MENRNPVVAGRFYSDNKTTLLKDLSKFFGDAKTNEIQNETIAIISPHAGYIYSGEVAAKAFIQVNPNTNFENIFILAPSHSCSFNGASIYNRGNYITPLGEVLVNLNLANYLINEFAEFTYYPEAHASEHSLEVQLPFIQYWINTDINIVPIVVGTQNDSVMERIAGVLEPYFNENNLFVISSDFSHFPNYYNANKADELTVNAIVSNKIEQLKNTIQSNSKISGLSTSACGLSGIIILMHLAQDKTKYKFKKIAYKNSGDIRFGDKDRVVGYGAISVIKKTDSLNEFTLLASSKKVLLNVCKESILNKKFNADNISEASLDEELKVKCGVFVSVYIKEKLRGCIGRFKSDKPLWKLVSIVGIQSAYNDSRFDTIKTEELKYLSIEISVISPFKKIDSIEEIELGKHGIYIRKGINSGTFLPQVAIKAGWTKEEFLGHCSKDKTGIGWDGWKNAELYIYTAEVFKGN